MMMMRENLELVGQLACEESGKTLVCIVQQGGRIITYIVVTAYGYYEYRL